MQNIDASRFRDENQRTRRPIDAAQRHITERARSSATENVPECYDRKRALARTAIGRNQASRRDVQHDARVAQICYVECRVKKEVRTASRFCQLPDFAAAAYTRADSTLRRCYACGAADPVRVAGGGSR